MDRRDTATQRSPSDRGDDQIYPLAVQCSVAPSARQPLALLHAHVCVYVCVHTTAALARFWGLLKQ